MRGYKEVTHFERRIQMKRLFAIALICMFGLALGCGGATTEAAEPEAEGADVAAAEEEAVEDEGLGEEEAPMEEAAEEEIAE